MLRRLIQMAWACLVLASSHAAIAAQITHAEYKKGVGVIRITGVISRTDVEKFRQISLKYRLALVSLDSNGGELLPGIEIGRIIKVAGYDTFVDEDAVCASSCALIWVAGATRYLSPTGQVGFHASYRDNRGRLEESGVANALVGNYLTLLNLPTKAIVFATSASPDEILWLTHGNRIAAGISFEELSGEKDDSAKPTPTVPPPPIQLAVAPPPIRTMPLRQLSALPPSFPSRLSQNGERWVKFAGNAYYDTSSITDAYQGARRGKDIWVIADQSAQKDSKELYMLLLISLDCTARTYITKTESYQPLDLAKAPTTFDSVKRLNPVMPGTWQKSLAESVCE